MISFEESLKDIAGLTAYREGELPKWVRKKLWYWGIAQDIHPKDDVKVIDKLYCIDDLGHWGVATVDGEEVAVFECLRNEIESLKVFAFHAYYIECGFNLLERSELYQGGHTTIITEHYPLTPRPRAAKLPAGDAFQSIFDE